MPSDSMNRQQEHHECTDTAWLLYCGEESYISLPLIKETSSIRKSPLVIPSPRKAHLNQIVQLAYKERISQKISLLLFILTSPFSLFLLLLPLFLLSSSSGFQFLRLLCQLLFFEVCYYKAEIGHPERGCKPAVCLWAPIGLTEPSGGLTLFGKAGPPRMTIELFWSTTRKGSG